MQRLTALITALSLLALLVVAGCKSDNSNHKKVNKNLPETKAHEVSNNTDDPTILFFGNSLTAGYGLSPDQSFPSLIEDTIISQGLKYQVVNAGLSGETTSGGLNRIDWVLNQKVDIFVLELGANDMLRGLPVEETKINLTAIIHSVKGKYPKAKIALCEMKAAPNMGTEYIEKFESLYTEIAASEKVLLIPFFLNDVSDPSLLLPDGKHPNADGQKIVARYMWSYVSRML